MANTKKYILTSVILGSIAAVAAGLIALTNLVTEKKIAQNEQNSVNLGIKNIFGDSASIKSEKDLDGHKYTVHLYEVENSSNEFLGYAFKCEGSNMYGKISLLSGFDALTHDFIKLHLITNEQSYASTLVENYVTPLNSNDRKLEDVSCGATYGAKLVRDMVNEASEVALSLWK